jgi:hypothetical protein
LSNFFFEWAIGQPISEFAQRLRKRLEGMMRVDVSPSVFDVVAKVLALNRLYAIFPAKAIDEDLNRNADLGSAFDRLMLSDDHFQFAPQDEGYRLIHPHLANAIYTAWFGRPEQKRHRKAHLEAGIEAALKHGTSPSNRFAPLWAISRATSDRGRVSDDMPQRLAQIETELRELLAALYKRHFATSVNKLAELPVWTDLDAQLELALAPSPINLIFLRRA